MFTALTLVALVNMLFFVRGVLATVMSVVPRGLVLRIAQNPAVLWTIGWVRTHALTDRGKEEDPDEVTPISLYLVKDTTAWKMDFSWSKQWVQAHNLLRLGSRDIVEYALYSLQHSPFRGQDDLKGITVVARFRYHGRMWTCPLSEFFPASSIMDIKGTVLRSPRVIDARMQRGNVTAPLREVLGPVQDWYKGMGDITEQGAFHSFLVAALDEWDEWNAGFNFEIFGPGGDSHIRVVAFVDKKLIREDWDILRLGGGALGGQTNCEETVAPRINEGADPEQTEIAPAEP